jgi:hypothetical protein
VAVSRGGQRDPPGDRLVLGRGRRAGARAPRPAPVQATFQGAEMSFIVCWQVPQPKHRSRFSNGDSRPKLNRNTSTIDDP